MDHDLQGAMQDTRARVEARLDELLYGGPERLIEAMRYAVLGGGKRLRPILCLWTHDMLAERESEPVLDVASALELIHTYSLVHDDLPCMDDDDLRRGRPTCHVRFGEALALLVGDALLNRAYEVIVEADWSERERAWQCVRTLAAAASHRQLVGGQALDLEAEGAAPSAERVEAIHSAKTAALIRASIVCGGASAGATPDALQRLGHIGQRLGLAFQIVDDVLDVTRPSEQLGKTAGKDVNARKLTYPAVFGIERSHRQARAHIDAACAALGSWPRSARLQALARWIGTRLH
ncbi:MAG: polyprenyl synthetase family protein [Candidatus Latescibacterota bacterium]|nr:MAG: polyprenyl synthetase family protein [Candidatus Latescibacterota bacterium]